jgi:hypothetical protein
MIKYRVLKHKNRSPEICLQAGEFRSFIEQKVLWGSGYNVRNIIFRHGTAFAATGFQSNDHKMTTAMTQVFRGDEARRVFSTL